MTLVLDIAPGAGGLRVAVACDVEVHAHSIGRRIVGRASKFPVAVLMHDGTELTAMDMKGRQLDVATLGKECPGLLDAFGVADLPV